MKKTSALVLAALIALGTVFTGCGGGTKVESQTSTQTLGQEMMDLQKARDTGAMTEKEYESAKKALMKKYK